MSKPTTIQGVLEINHDRGIIYFHTTEGWTALRICSLPTPIPAPSMEAPLDITHQFGTSWGRVPQDAGCHIEDH